jgi:hypothetical protein
MKNTLTFTIIAAAVILFSSCENRSICIKGNGDRQTKSIDVADFTGVELDGSFDVIVIQGNRFKVEAIGDDNILNSVSAKEVGGVCKLDLADGCYKDYDLTIEVTMPELTDVFLDGSGDFTIEDFDNADQLNLEIEGSGNINIYDQANLNNLKATIDGSGNIEFKRIVADINSIKAIVNGSGNFDGFTLNADNVITRISGSGNCEVNASSTLKATIEGSGNILYKGNPTITKSISGSGSIINAN